MSDPQDRDELCQIISQAVGGWNASTRAITNVADAIIKAGWQPPPTPPGPHCPNPMEIDTSTYEDFGRAPHHVGLRMPHPLQPPCQRRHLN